MSPQNIEIEIIYDNTGKLDWLLSIGPLYLAIHDLWVSLARVSSTRYTYRHTYLHGVSTFLGS
jgi:uncharacterized membrane protein YjdF